MIRWRLGRFGLDFDTDYGIDRREGWSAVWDGMVVVEFVLLPRAVFELLRAPCRWRDGNG